TAIDPLTDLDEVTEIGDSFADVPAPAVVARAPAPAPTPAPKPAPASTDAGAIPEENPADEPSDWQLELTRPGPSSLFAAKPPIETSIPPRELRAAAPEADGVTSPALPRPSAAAGPIPQASPAPEITVPEAHVPGPTPAPPPAPAGDAASPAAALLPDAAEADGLADLLEPSIEGAVAAAAPRPKRRWWVRGLLAGVQVLLPLLLFAAGFGYVQYLQLEKDLPSLASIKNYRPPIVTEIHDANGELIGKYAEEERYVLPLDKIPPMVRHAFLAAEDADFYNHKGIDYKSILRALVKNAESGNKKQGASTITQQVARAFLLSREKTYRRKVQEILLSRKIEEELTKDEILHRYLNQIFFGKGAYGVEAAARIHFGKHAADLSIAEAALLAGLPQAPSNYSPETHPDEALRRRHYVLGQMRDNGWITKDEYAAADKEPLALAVVPDPTLVAAPWSTEQLRRDLITQFGHEAVYRGGLQVTSTVDLKLEAAAQQSVRDGLALLDRRMGYRGAPSHVDADKIDATAAALGKTAPAVGARTRGVVEEVTQEHAYVRLAGGAKGVLHVLDNPWAYPPNPEQYWKYRVAADLGKVLKAGDVIDVAVIDEKTSLWTLDQAAKAKKKGFKPDAKLAAKLEGRLALTLLQQPEIEGALLSFHIPDGRVLAMTGGTDFEKSQFIRPIQAKRQVGSTFKTIVYAAALSKLPPDILDPDNAKPRPRAKATPPAKLLAALTQAQTGPTIWTLASILLDAPVVMTPKEAELTSKAGGNKETDEPATEDWKPSNYGNKYYGDTPLRTAFILSRNLPTLQLAQKVGVKDIMAMARKLGVESDLPPDLSIALGSASLSLLEMTRAHATIANGGIPVQPRFLEKVVDRDGKTLFDLETELQKNAPDPVIDPKPAFVMTQLLTDVAKFGTAAKASDLKRPSGGKTGTTNDYIDAWYIGFTPSIVTGVWVGYDQVRSLGVGETGGEAALPIWMQYMKTATAGLPREDFTPPDGVVKLKIDRKSGKLAYPGESGEDMVETWFVKGTEPLESARPGKFNDTPNIFQADPGLR
ncbi:MAG TPA: transglycosylase domain-containing protein, partial [bacterium]|nr:transglycosylase domain-containing protein [bacterium]